MSNDFLVASQRPSEGKTRSPLADAEKPPVTIDPGVIVTEMTTLGFLVVRAKSEQWAGIETALDCNLPVVPLSSLVHGELCIRWMSPTEWLVTLPAESLIDLEIKLREKGGGQIAVVDNSGGFVCIHLYGPAAELVIRKSTSYDIHSSNFPLNKVVSTTFAQSQAFLRRIGDLRFELIFRRSFADYIWRWLLDASMEYGLRLD